MRLRHSGRLFLLLSIALSTACRNRSAADEFQKEMQTVTSWAATAHMVGEAWLRGAVPTRYARRTLQSAEETLAEERSALGQLPSLEGDRLAQTLQHLQKLETTVEEMRNTVETGDRARVGQQIEDLARHEQTLKSFTQHARGQP
jgi:hypothetical protein